MAKTLAERLNGNTQLSDVLRDAKYTKHLVEIHDFALSDKNF